jgi:hypothetical protein
MLYIARRGEALLRLAVLLRTGLTVTVDFLSSTGLMEEAGGGGGV